MNVVSILLKVTNPTQMLRLQVALASTFHWISRNSSTREEAGMDLQSQWLFTLRQLAQKSRLHHLPPRLPVHPQAGGGAAAEMGSTPNTARKKERKEERRKHIPSKAQKEQPEVRQPQRWLDKMLLK